MDTLSYYVNKVGCGARTSKGCLINWWIKAALIQVIKDTATGNFPNSDLKFRENKAQLDACAWISKKNLLPLRERHLCSQTQEYKIIQNFDEFIKIKSRKQWKRPWVRSLNLVGVQLKYPWSAELLRNIDFSIKIRRCLTPVLLPKASRTFLFWPQSCS